MALSVGLDAAFANMLNMEEIREVNGTKAHVTSL
jgi:hypothetical protein